ANDLLMMNEAALSIAYHAKPTVQAQASCSLNYSGLDAVLDFLG
ncbi:MAG TPA: phosphoserine phosphatase SerB, partial [Thiomicrospira sp.]|nr:phosphoserine phosphatase SerB [Thiomicrospira sp.]